MTRIEVACTDLDAAIASYADLGFRHDMIMPADAPRLAQLSGHGLTLRLALSNAPHATHDATTGLIITRAGDAWGQGRAGMQYRDLIPSRMGGRFIASHIRIPEGGPVADYVHHHDIRFQMIYCRKGWVRVVYEDQGPPFVMHEGDCVLQPPHIRHRVLEASRGLEVIEIASPAAHETWRDHNLKLPSSTVNRERIYAGQRFVRHIAAEGTWSPRDGIDVRDAGIAEATQGLGRASVIRFAPGATLTRRHDGEFLFLSMLDGQVRLRSQAHGEHVLSRDDACVLMAGDCFTVEAASPAQLLEVALPA